MSGGYLKEGLKAGEHQVVIFTFKGPISAATCRRWNLQIDDLKRLLGDSAIGVTIQGLDTPDAFKKPPK
jgi:hypothetical protein